MPAFDLNVGGYWLRAPAQMSTKQANLRFRNLESVVLPSAAWTNPFRFDILATAYNAVAHLCAGVLKCFCDASS